MPAAPLPTGEEDRLAELLRYDILDTPPEEPFDRLTELAAYICQTPVSLISLIDRHRQWVKSRVGPIACETPRDWAFCGYTLLGTEPCIIRDATRDERVKDNPLVLEEPSIRFYAGYPLISPKGHNLGSLCAIDFVPRDLEPDRLKYLQILAEQAVTLLEGRLHRKQVAEYAESLKDAKERAERANQAKTLFLSTVSHEIRTPLNGVVGMLQLLSETHLDPQQRDFLKTARTSAAMLLSVVNEVLDFSSIEAGKIELNLKPADLRQIVEETRLVLKSAAADKTIDLCCHLDPDIPEYLILDGSRLRQILINLCGNAVKFTPVGGRVEVTARAMPATVGRVKLEIAVSDMGDGIAAEDCARILEPFFRASTAASLPIEGTGLGLAITNRLLNLMGSALQIGSTPGYGSCFSFVLECPIAVGGPETGPRLKTVTTERPLQILVAEDNAVNQKVISTLLEHRGHCVTIARDGAEAVRWCQEEAFDLILMDLEMPNMDGAEATKHIRKSPHGVNGNTPIFALTAHAIVGLHDRAIALMDGYISKPIRIEEIERAIAKIANRG